MITASTILPLCHVCSGTGSIHGFGLCLACLGGRVSLEPLRPPAFHPRRERAMALGRATSARRSGNREQARAWAIFASHIIPGGLP